MMKEIYDGSHVQNDGFVQFTILNNSLKKEDKHDILRVECGYEIIEVFISNEENLVFRALEGKKIVDEKQTKIRFEGDRNKLRFSFVWDYKKGNYKLYFSEDKYIEIIKRPLDPYFNPKVSISD